MTKVRRERRGEGSVHRRPNGGWCGQIDLGPSVEGTRRRRTIYAPTEDELRKKMKAERRVLDDKGDLSTSDLRLEQWLDDWLVRVVGKKLKPNGMRAYRTAVNKHIKPSIGKIRLSRLGVAHIRKMHADIIDRLDLSPTTALHAHRVLSSALADAVLEGRVGQNIASVVPAPAKADNDRTSMSPAVAKRIMFEADDSRWYVGILLGIRRGERLGLRWSHVDLDLGVVDLAWSLSEVGWAHGCGDICGLTKVRCPKRVHPIPKGMRHELLGNRALALLPPKTRKSRRVVPLPAPVVEILQRQQEITGGSQYDLVWCDPTTGAPIPPRRDWQEWHDLLVGYKIPHIEPHEMRHTTATLLMEMNVPDEVIGAILGHSSTVTTRGYQHANLEVSRNALNGLAAKLELTASAAALS